MNKNTLGVLCAASTGLLWALNSPTSKLLGESGADMLTVVFFRCLLTPLPLGIWIRLCASSHFRVGRRDLAVLFLISPLAPYTSS